MQTIANPKTGTEKHHTLIPKMNTFETLVCFALTELGHGYVL